MAIVSRTLTVLPEYFAICCLRPEETIPAWAKLKQASFFSITQTKEELSLICPQRQVPADVTADTGWRCFKLEGPFELEEPGVIASMVTPLAQANIGVFAIATYDTDYLLVKEFERAVQTFERLTHRVLQ